MPMPMPMSIFTCTWTRSHKTYVYTYIYDTCIYIYIYEKAYGLQWRKVIQYIRPTILASSQSTTQPTVRSSGTSVNVQCRMQFFIDCDGVQTHKIPHLNSRLTDMPCHITHTCIHLCCLHYSVEVAPLYQVSELLTHTRTQIHAYMY